ncbi:MAG TPA: prepilin peptidase [Syntrophomonadaceae bacterium]|nr:prepilin peptidase [Syntrophomonadaceae bacterium]HPR92808.1 prepilin peptidase [Syntrophomonadaceae bacterium]
MQDLVLLLILLICVITDLKERRIYNAVLLPGMFFGFIYNLTAGGWQGLTQSLLGLLLGLGILIIPFAIGGMGAGDVKLLAVVGAVKGPLFVFYSTMGMALAGGMIALLVLIYKTRIISDTVRFFQALRLMLTSGFKIIEFDFINKNITIPYGLAIAAGAAGAFWWMR